MMDLKEDAVLIGAAVLLALVAAAYLKGHAAEVGAGVVGAVGDAAGGAIQEAGTWIGIPKTSQTACEKAIASGDVWRQIWDCPASTALGNWF
jgi:hypothetical protein